MHAGQNGRDLIFARVFASFHSSIVTPQHRHTLVHRYPTMPAKVSLILTYHGLMPETVAEGYCGQCAEKVLELTDYKPQLSWNVTERDYIEFTIFLNEVSVRYADWLANMLMDWHRDAHPQALWGQRSWTTDPPEDQDWYGNDTA